MEGRGACRAGRRTCTRRTCRSGLARRCGSARPEEGDLHGPAMSAATASAAAAGSAASVIGRPTTMRSAPAATASRASRRAWSSACAAPARRAGFPAHDEHARRMRRAAPTRAASRRARWPRLHARQARHGRSARPVDADRRERRVVMAGRSDGEHDRRRDAGRRVRRRPRPRGIIAAPPSAWTVRNDTPSRAASRRPATVLGMSCSLRSRKTMWPADRNSSTIDGPSAMNASRPT